MDHGLKACFLVASPSLQCPFFNHTVVLLVDHRDDGALGFVVNKPSDVDFEEILDQIGLEDATIPGSTAVMLGGPVSPNTGWVVFDPTRKCADREGVLVVGDKTVEQVGVSANMDLLEDIAKGDGPSRFVMMLGYAGWGPGQLDDEIRDGAWIPVDLDPKLVFETPVDDRWNAALSTLGIDPARVVSGPAVA